jgi:hypothetical protein
MEAAADRMPVDSKIHRLERAFVEGFGKGATRAPLEEARIEAGIVRHAK